MFITRLKLKRKRAHLRNAVSSYFIYIKFNLPISILVSCQLRVLNASNRGSSVSRHIYGSVLFSASEGTVMQSVQLDKLKVHLETLEKVDQVRSMLDFVNTFTDDDRRAIWPDVLEAFGRVVRRGVSVG